MLSWQPKYQRSTGASGRMADSFNAFVLESLPPVVIVYAFNYNFIHVLSSNE